jgi:hypothetical protein
MTPAPNWAISGIDAAISSPTATRAAPPRGRYSASQTSARSTLR